MVMTVMPVCHINMMMVIINLWLKICTLHTSSHHPSIKEAQCRKMTTILGRWLARRCSTSIPMPRLPSTSLWPTMSSPIPDRGFSHNTLLSSRTSQYCTSDYSKTIRIFSARRHTSGNLSPMPTSVFFKCLSQSWSYMSSLPPHRQCLVISLPSSRT